jgi:hypothetical protein
MEERGKRKEERVRREISGVRNSGMRCSPSSAILLSSFKFMNL